MVGRTDISRCCCGCVRIGPAAAAEATVTGDATLALAGGVWTLTRLASGSITGRLLFVPRVSSSAPFYCLARVTIHHGTERPNFRVKMLLGANDSAADGMAYTRFVAANYFGATLGSLANYAETADCAELLDSAYPVGPTSTSFVMFARSNGSSLLATNSTTDANGLGQVGTGLVDRAPSYGGNRFGFEISELSSDVTSVEIDQLSAGPLTSGSDVCQIWRTNCCDGAVPDHATLEIAGLPADDDFGVLLTTYSGSDVYQWFAPVDLSPFDGSYVVENGPFVVDADEAVWWSYCRSDEQCVWGIWLDVPTATLQRYPAFGFPVGQPATDYPQTLKMLLKVTMFRYLNGTVDHLVEIYLYDATGTEVGQRYYSIDSFTAVLSVTNFGRDVPILGPGRITSLLSDTDNSPCEHGVTESNTEYSLWRTASGGSTVPVWTDLTGTWSV